MTPTGAFHGDPTQKALYLTRARHAEQLGHIIQGTYWEDGKGCAVGVLIHGDDHAALAAALNIPRAIIDTLPTFHDRQAAEQAARFPARFIGAIPVGGDLTRVLPRLTLWVLETETMARLRPEDRPATERVIALLRRFVAGGTVTADEWSSAAKSAWYAAQSAAIMRMAEHLLVLLSEAPVPTPTEMTDGDRADVLALATR